MMKLVLPCFNPQFMFRARRESYKMSHVPGFPVTQVPQEAAYQTELERILTTWLAGVPVIPQQNAGGRKRCDLVVTPSQQHRIVLELVASDTIDSIKEHFTCALSSICS